MNILNFMIQVCVIFAEDLDGDELNNGTRMTRIKPINTD